MATTRTSGPRTAIDVDPNVFERYVGYYQLNPRSIFTITREGDRLFAQLTGQPKRRLFAASESEYFYKLVTAQITFVGDAGEQATGLVLHQNGREFPSIRVDETQASCRGQGTGADQAARRAGATAHRGRSRSQSV